MSTPSVHSLQKQCESARKQLSAQLTAELNELLTTKSELKTEVRLLAFSTRLITLRSALRAKKNDVMSTAMQRFYDSVDSIGVLFNPDADPVGHFIKSEEYCKCFISEVGLDVMKSFVMRDGERIFEVALAKTIGHYLAYNTLLCVIELVRQLLSILNRVKVYTLSSPTVKSRIEDNLGFRTPGEKSKLLEIIENELSVVNELLDSLALFDNQSRRRSAEYEVLQELTIYKSLNEYREDLNDLKDEFRAYYDNAESMVATSISPIRIVDGISKTDVLRILYSMIETKMIHKLPGTSWTSIFEGVSTSNWDNLKSRILHDPALNESATLEKFLLHLIGQTSTSFQNSLISKLNDNNKS